MNRRELLKILSGIILGTCESIPLTKISSQEEVKYQGIFLELNYQKTLEGELEGKNLFLFGDDAVMSIGNYEGAANTLIERLKGFIEKEYIKKKEDIIELLSGNRNKFKRVYYFGHGNVDSLWITTGSPETYLTRQYLHSLPNNLINKIRDNLEECNEFKLYCCHSAADHEFPIAAVIADRFNINSTGSNAWVFIANYNDEVYMFPATREDYRNEFDTNHDDQLYSGPSQWLHFFRKNLNEEDQKLAIVSFAQKYPLGILGVINKTNIDNMLVPLYHFENKKTSQFIQRRKNFSHNPLYFFTFDDQNYKGILSLEIEKGQPNIVVKYFT